MSNRSRLIINYFISFKLLLLLLLITSISFIFCEKPSPPTSYFPETGKYALYQRSLDLKNNINVLSIATQPGKEDLTALAYLRLGKGATIVSAYVTNGESGESDIQAEYPHAIAAIRRNEAVDALSFLDGEVHFLNMPDIAAARDTDKVSRLWQPDTLIARLKKLIIISKPNIIFISPGWASEEKNPLLQILRASLIKAVNQLSTKNKINAQSGPESDKYWDVNRIFAARFEDQYLKIPCDNIHPKWKKSFRTIGEEAALKYLSLKIQRDSWLNRGYPAYQLIYPEATENISQIDENLNEINSTNLRSIKKKITDLSETIIRGKTRGALKQLVAIKDSISIFLISRYMMHPSAREALFDWNSAIENLRNTLLGVEVKYTVSDTKLTARQLTFLSIDEVKGLQDEGETEIFFSGTDQGWIINEAAQRKLPLKVNEQYRLVSPEIVNFNFPYGHQRIQSATEGTPYFFFIIHNAKEKSFIYRGRINFSFGPKFVTEVLTPIVRMVPGEGVVVRLTNISRDGVADRIRVENELASSPESYFRLNTKESFLLDTLSITWNGNPEDGSYLIPVKISGIPVANFVARKFETQVDTLKKIGLISGLKNSPTQHALRRLNRNFSNIILDQSFSNMIDSLNILIIDRRALTLKPQLAQFKNTLDEFVNKGGHLLILAQDASSWKTNPLWRGIELKNTILCDETLPVDAVSSHDFLKTPNRITGESWDGWLFQRSYNIVTGSALEDAEIPVKAKQQNLPFIVTKKDGSGKRTYVDLALGHQFMNVNPGAFRLFANLISY
ncbi:PIG-L family deacetylase [candidate division KSB1 bacterium]|nr:PIG-L family deacetylase [candidate division KSB1 bacterium]